MKSFWVGTWNILDNLFPNLPVKKGYVIYAYFVHYSVEFYFDLLPFMIFTLYNIDYILNIVYYHVYSHSKQLELSIQFMFSHNRDFRSVC